MLHRLAGLALAGAALLVPSAPALAAPVTVQLRVEGSGGTLFEGPVTTDARTALAPTAGGAGHPCDVGQNTSPTSATRAATPTTALADSGVSWAATWSASSFGDDFLISRVGSDASGGSTFWAVAVNDKLLDVGGCQAALQPGDDVLWAFDGFGKPLLRLTGPATALAGTPVVLSVRDGRDGTPVAGATVAGATTDAAGNASVTLAQPGVQRIKAEAPGSVRSNALAIAVGAAAQPTTAPVPVVAPPDRTAPHGRILSPRNGHTYRLSRFSPRLIRISVVERGSGVQTVKLRLTRRVGRRCWSYSGRRERFIGIRCGRGFSFRVSDRARFDYLLPNRLRRGHYVLDVAAIDRAFNRDGARVRGRNRSVFDVR